MQRIYNILTSILGESKQGGYDKEVTQYQFNCPYCADEEGGVDHKFNLEISFKLGKFHCWKCGAAGGISKLIKARGGKTLADDYFAIIKDIKETKYYNLDLFKDNGDIFEEKNITLPKTFRKINLSTCRDKALCSYLTKRGLTQELIDYYNIGSTTWDEEDWTWRNRVIIPSYDSVGNLNYFVGRTYKPNDKRNKYKNCDANKFDIIFNEDKIQMDSDIWLCEGIFDSLVYYNTIPLMGKILNNKMELYQRLIEDANSNIIICLDGDTDIEETKKIYALLNRGRLRNKIWYINMAEDSKYKDFSEIYENEGKKGIIDIFKTKKQFSDMDLLY